MQTGDEQGEVGNEFGNGVSERAVVEVVDVRRTYNLPLFEAFLVIDCRDRKCYLDGHIASALNFPPPVAGEPPVANLVSFLQYAFDECCNDRWDPIVIYGDDTEAVAAHVSWVVENLSQFINFPVVAPDADSFLTCMAQRARCLWILQGGYSAFVNQYPVLNHASEKTGADAMRPLPYHLSAEGGGIFLGSRAIDWSKDLIQQMRIQAIVLDDVAARKVEAQNVGTPLDCFFCSLSNGGAQDAEQVTVWERNRLEKLLEKATEFIQNAILTHRRVLLQLEGRSASAALAIAWFMRYRNQTFDEARAAVFASTLRNPADGNSSVLDKTLLLERELRQWEQSARFRNYSR